MWNDRTAERGTEERETAERDFFLYFFFQLFQIIVVFKSAWTNFSRCIQLIVTFLP